MFDSQPGTGEEGERSAEECHVLRMQGLRASGRGRPGWLGQREGKVSAPGETAGHAGGQPQAVWLSCIRRHVTQVWPCTLCLVQKTAVRVKGKGSEITGRESS